ncbi:efflux RND transporter periplasmic adaptor subunit [Rhodopseudomonas palustris]|uniref:efflux RND transporter periplasmic adaptor subunit n=1 Tax=Rhodopseudomonas palustris TaxID=1076 RepID=UPI0006427A8F|nr:efflux RND transporter periplasmic adaptor subunit [Rhodopseudomonas palustris]QDL96684.1 efflux RND transporter periplasmic adaptor subunit [Rhodopseudomonas palustris]
MRDNFIRNLRLRRSWWIAAACLVAGVAVGGYELAQFERPGGGHTDISSQSRRSADRYTPTPAEWASLTIEPVRDRSFRAEHVTEGKIAIDEDRATPVFSPYAGRVTKLLARPGDRVTKGQPLFTIEAPDTVQAQNDFISASTALNKAKSQLELAQLQDKRAHDLFEGKAVPLKDYQQAQATLIAAQNDFQSATTALEAARNRLRILGLSEAAISAFQDKGQINPETTIVAPIAGTVVQRKVGPGQYVNAGASDPVYMIGDLSTVWLTAFVRESEAADIDEGLDVSFQVLALPGRTLTGRIDYVAAAIDPATRRLTVRATIDNPGGLLKPEMFANVTIYSPSDHPAVGVPRQALIYEGDQVRVWVAHDDRSIELRTVKPGLSAGDLVEVTGNLRPGEKVVTKGSLFIDRAATG